MLGEENWDGREIIHSTHSSLPLLDEFIVIIVDLEGLIGLLRLNQLVHLGLPLRVLLPLSMHRCDMSVVIDPVGAHGVFTIEESRTGGFIERLGVGGPDVPS